MAHISPLPPEDIPHLQERLDMARQLMGFVPNSMPTMARVPGLVEAFSDLAAAVLANPKVPVTLCEMVAQIASSAAGCRYCQAHTTHIAGHLGIPEEKLADLWLWETSEHFDDAERAALTLAFHAASVPNTVTEEHFDELRRHYDDEQILVIVGTISFFGFLNRWNDTLATDLEDEPFGTGERVLNAAGWQPGKHRQHSPRRAKPTDTTAVRKALQ